MTESADHIGNNPNTGAARARSFESQATQSLSRRTPLYSPQVRLGNRHRHRHRQTYTNTYTHWQVNHWQSNLYPGPLTAALRLKLALGSSAAPSPAAGAASQAAVTAPAVSTSLAAAAAATAITQLGPARRAADMVAAALRLPRPVRVLLLGVI